MQLANRKPDDLRSIVKQAIEAGDTRTLQATLGAPEHIVALGASRAEMMRKYEDQGPVVGNYSVATYRDRLRQLKERLGHTRKSVREHFDGVLTPQQKADLKKARERQAAAQNL
ncbi:MAG: hypothetical protein U5K43_15470 [Halofilum sp. (in: g-proteobacteria)]|nr:hypothetical protein [Halofilum sp. (in: g-proteobacteria)]